MNAGPVRGYFVTGTGPGVGKTLVAAALLRRFAAAGRRVAGMKPVATGAVATSHGLRSADAMVLARESTPRPDYALVNPYAFARAGDPAAAARAAGVAVDVRRIEDAFRALAASVDLVVVEGTGAWRTTLAPDLDEAGLARRLGLPLVLVVGLAAGGRDAALGHAHAIRDEGLVLAGWIGMRIDQDWEGAEATRASIGAALSAPELGRVAPCATPDVRAVAACLDLARLA